MPAGNHGRVFFLGRVSIKLPRLARYSPGMQCNAWEREMWRKWRPLFPCWTNLCPILFADPLGLVVIMRRGQQPVSPEAVRAAIDTYPSITAELKPEDWGLVDGKVVALDYGITADIATKQRAYFESHQSAAIQQ